MRDVARSDRREEAHATRTVRSIRRQIPETLGKVVKSRTSVPKHEMAAADASIPDGGLLVSAQGGVKVSSGVRIVL